MRMRVMRELRELESEKMYVAAARIRYWTTDSSFVEVDEAGGGEKKRMCSFLIREYYKEFPILVYVAVEDGDGGLRADELRVQTFPLLSLPPELRTTIYRHALGENPSPYHWHDG